MGFLRTILIILLVYYLLKILAKWFGPKLFSYAARRTERHFQERFDQFQNQSTTVEDEEIGKVTVEKKTATQKRDSKEVGEYIDFEEIE